jgi:hypothetical protein
MYSNQSSVADPGCLSQIPVPDFPPSWIPDQSKNEKEKKHFFKAVVFLYFVLYLLYFFLTGTDKYLSQSTQNLSIQDLDKMYPGYRIQGSKRQRISEPRSGSTTLDRNEIFYSQFFFIDSASPSGLNMCLKPF